MISLLITLSTGDSFTCDHNAEDFATAVADIFSKPGLLFEDTAINTQQIVTIENNDRVKTIPVVCGGGDKGSAS